MPEHIVTCCEDCVAENQGTCLLSDESLQEFRRENRGGESACPMWCPLRKGPVLLRLEPDEEKEVTSA